MRFTQMKRLIKDVTGVTLMELIIVLAIIAIISAIVAPNFLSATDRARLKSDIQSAAVLQSAIELYDAESGGALSDSDDMAPSVAPSGEATVSVLRDKGYISGAQTKPQTDGLKWVYKDQKVKVNINGCSDKIKTEIYNALSQQEKDLVVTPAS